MDHSPHDDRAGAPDAIIDLATVRTLEELAAALRVFQRIRGDGISIREIARRTELDPVPVLRSTTSDALNAKRLVSKEKTRALAAALGATAEELPAWERAWERVAAGLSSSVPPRRGELEELREIVTRLEETIAAQRKELTELRSRVPVDSARVAGRSGRNRVSGPPVLRKLATSEVMTSGPQTAREAVKEAVADIVGEHRPALQMFVREQIATKVSDMASEVLKKAIGEAVDRRRTALQSLVDHEMVTSAPDMIREELRDAVHDFT